MLSDRMNDIIKAQFVKAEESKRLNQRAPIARPLREPANEISQSRMFAMQSGQATNPGILAVRTTIVSGKLLLILINFFCFQETHTLARRRLTS
jgi:hypothetical protein